MEGLAVDGDGTLYAVSEGRLGGGYPVFRFAGGAWSVFDTLPTHGGFRPVGADIGSDGFLYLLERKVRPPFRFASRVRRFEIGASGLENPLVLLESELGQHDNLEGIAVWHDGGALRLTMVSDDNYLWVQRTEFVEYGIIE